jgi:hypothetical protein
MKTLATFLLILTSAPILSQRAGAQGLASAAVGDRVRISRFGGSARAGRLVARNSDSIVVKWMNGSQDRIPVFEVGRFEVSRGRRRYLIGGTMGGLAVGAGVGLLLKSYREQDLGYDAYGSEPPTKRNLFPIAVASGTVLGVLIGAMGTERWQPASVSASGTRIGLVMSGPREGIGLVVSGSW